MRLFALAVLAFSSLFATTSFAATPLVGKWRIAAIAGADGFDAGRTQAEFAANGRFGSTVGCNRIAGKPEISGGKLAFGPIISTRMACPPPLDEIERAYLEALRNVRGYRLSGKTLAFLDESGDALVTLVRVK